MAQPEPRNPFYILLLLASLLFVVTALAVAVVPVVEKWQIQRGSPPADSAFRDFLRTDGWRLLPWELGAMVLFGLLSMALDRLRRLQNDRAAATIPPGDAEQTPAGELRGPEHNRASPDNP